MGLTVSLGVDATISSSTHLPLIEFELVIRDQREQPVIEVYTSDGQESLHSYVLSFGRPEVIHQFKLGQLSDLDRWPQSVVVEVKYTTASHQTYSHRQTARKTEGVFPTIWFATPHTDNDEPVVIR